MSSHAHAPVEQPSLPRLKRARTGRTEGNPQALRGYEHARAGPQRPRRPEHKLQKKAPRSKGTRGRADDAGAAYDGAAIAYGKRGGLVRAPGGS